MSFSFNQLDQMPLELTNCLITKLHADIPILETKKSECIKQIYVLWVGMMQELFAGVLFHLVPHHVMHTDLLGPY